MQDLETYAYSPSNIAKHQDLDDMLKIGFALPNKYPIETYPHSTYFDSHIGYIPTLFSSYKLQQRMNEKLTQKEIMNKEKKEIYLHSQ